MGWPWRDPSARTTRPPTPLRSGKSRNTGPIVTSANPASSGQATICHAATASVSFPVTQQAMSNAWLKEQGLLSVKDLWCKAQGYSA